MKQRAEVSPVLFCSLLLVSGIVMGALGIRVLSPDETAELISYLEVFMRGLSSPGLEPHVILRLSLAHNLKVSALLWAFGLAIIGAPLTCLMLFIRGFALGFSSAFVIKQVPNDGFLVFASGMLPHNLVAVPVLVLLSAASLSFSVKLFRERPWAHGGLIKLSTAYTLRFALLSLPLMAASLVEAYLTPLLLRKVAGYL